MPIDPIVKLDFSEVTQAHKRLSRAGRNLKPVWRKSAPLWKKDIRAAMKKREGPDGKHPRHAKATLAKKRQQRSSPTGKKWKRKMARGMLGKLWAPLTLTYNREAMRLVSKISWAGAHQEGATVGRGVSLPERTHIYVTAPVLDYVLKLINRRLKKAWLS